VELRICSDYRTCRFVGGRKLGHWWYIASYTLIYFLIVVATMFTSPKQQASRLRSSLPSQPTITKSTTDTSLATATTEMQATSVSDEQLEPSSSDITESSDSADGDEESNEKNGYELILYYVCYFFEVSTLSSFQIEIEFCSLNFIYKMTQQSVEACA
jgi:hypothetical protein